MSIIGGIKIYGASSRTLADVSATNIAIETARHFAVKYIAENSLLGRAKLIADWENTNKDDILGNRLAPEDKERVRLAYDNEIFWIGYNLAHSEYEPSYSRDWLKSFLNKNKSVYGSVRDNLFSSVGMGASGVNFFNNTELRDLVNNESEYSYNGIDVEVINYLWVAVPVPASIK